MSSFRITPPSDPNIPATKQDIFLVMEQIGTLYDANERWKKEILQAMDDRVVKAEKNIEKRLKLHFDFSVEHISSEIKKAKKDEIETMKDRFTRLEKHTGLIPVSS